MINAVPWRQSPTSLEYEGGINAGEFIIPVKISWVDLMTMEKEEAAEYLRGALQRRELIVQAMRYGND